MSLDLEYIVIILQYFVNEQMNNITNLYVILYSTFPSVLYKT